MCNNPLYRFVIGEGKWIKRLPLSFRRRIVAGGIIMNYFEMTTLCNVYSVPFEQFQTLPCGKCYGCLSDYQNMWTSRAICESSCHKENYFITLTYNDDNINLMPVMHDITGEIKQVGVLVKSDFSSFIKRLRAKNDYDGNKHSFKFLACGEYGDTTKRPHFHFLAFGLHIPDLKYFYSRDRRGKTHFDYRSDSTAYFLSDTIAKEWGKGFVLITPLTLENCAYTCSYVNKQITPKQVELNSKSKDILNAFNRQFDNYSKTVDNLVSLGRIQSPFLLMSRRSGIGKEFFDSKKQWDYALYDFLPAFNGRFLPKKTIRYFDNIVEKSDVGFIAIPMKERRKKKAQKTYPQWSDYGKQEMQDREYIAESKHKKKPARDL